MVKTTTANIGKEESLLRKTGFYKKISNCVRRNKSEKRVQMRHDSIYKRYCRNYPKKKQKFLIDSNLFELQEDTYAGSYGGLKDLMGGPQRSRKRVNLCPS